METESTDEEKDGKNGEPVDAATAIALGTRWVSQVFAHQVTGISRRELGRLGDKGEIQRKKMAEGGDWLYYLPDCIALSRAPVGARAAETAEQALARTRAELQQAQTDFIKATTTHAEKTWGLVHDPILAIMKELRTALAQANEDNVKLRAAMRETDEMRRRLENDEHARKMAHELLQSEQRRKDDALESVKKAAQHVWPGVEETLRGLTLLGRLKSTFDPDKIRALLAVPGMLSPDEAEMLRQIFGIVDTTAEPVEEAPSATEPAPPPEGEP